MREGAECGDFQVVQGREDKERNTDKTEHRKHIQLSGANQHLWIWLDKVTVFEFELIFLTIFV